MLYLFILEYRVAHVSLRNRLGFCKMMKSRARFSSYRVLVSDFVKTFKSRSRIFKPGSRRLDESRILPFAPPRFLYITLCLSHRGFLTWAKLSKLQSKNLKVSLTFSSLALSSDKASCFSQPRCSLFGNFIVINITVSNNNNESVALRVEIFITERVVLKTSCSLREQIM